VIWQITLAAPRTLSHRDLAGGVGLAESGAMRSPIGFIVGLFCALLLVGCQSTESAGLAEANPIDDGSQESELNCGTGCSATAVDTFDTGVSTNWVPFEDAASTLSVSAVTRPRRSGSAMKLVYSVSSSGYAAVETRFAAGQDWSASKALRVWLYGAKTGHPFRIELYDAGSEQFEYIVPVTWRGWKQVIVNFTSFTKSPSQPPGATQNDLLDLNGVKGLNFSPSYQSGTEGTLYVDELSVTTLGVTTGSVVPLYSHPTSGLWSTLISLHASHPKVPIAAIVDPANGPGTAVDPNYVAGIAALRNAGIVVLGYVTTSYMTRTSVAVCNDIQQWTTLYGGPGGINGVFFDEMSNALPNGPSYNASVATCADVYGVNALTVGNPGTEVTSDFVGPDSNDHAKVFDVTLLYEGAGYPPLSSLQGWHTRVDRSYFGIIPYGVPALDAATSASITRSKQYAKWLYVQDDVLPNPWDTLPPYLGPLLSLLDP
jgi:hypothetical protein